MTSPNPSGVTVTPPGWVDPHGWSRFPPYDPWVTVSPAGVATGAASANNGCSYGPDTPGTTTCGIQEAINSLPACTYSDKTPASIPGQTGWVLLQPGVYSMTGTVTVPAGAITITGAGWSSWIPVRSITPYENLGGTAVVTTAAAAFTCPVDSFGFPATMLNIRDLDIRAVSPATAGSGNTPAVLGLAGWVSGEMRNVQVMEVKTAGGIGTNLLRMIDARPFGSKDTTVMSNIRAWGGNIGMQIQAAHMIAIGLTAGGQSTNSIVTYPRAIDITDDLGCYWADLHVFGSTYGLTWQPYAGHWYSPSVLRGVMFEACTHYMTSAGSSPAGGTLILEQPCWNTSGLDPVTDIPANMAATLKIITRYEQDETGDAGQVFHLTAAPSTATAGASPYTFAALPYDAIYVLTTVGGMTQLTLDGQALFGGTFTAGQQVYVGAGHSLVATWATTAPVFEVLPV